MNNRDNLLACALDLFADYGYDAVGVQRIVEAADVTKPTLYHYFNSKEGLLQALLETHFNRLFETLEPATAYHGDLPQTLERITAAYFDFATRAPVFYRLQLAMRLAPAHSTPFQLTAPHVERQQRLLEHLFSQAAQDHGNMRGRHRAYAATFLGMINTYITLALTHPSVVLDEHRVYQAVHQFMHGIFS